MSKGRGGRKYMAAIAELKSRGEVQRCWRCGKTLYADAPRGHQLSITLGHLVALEDGGALLDPDNYAAECMKCNYGDGARRTNRKRSLAQRGTTTPQRISYRNPEWYEPYQQGKAMVFDQRTLRPTHACQICATHTRRMKYCSDQCMAEAKGRLARDRQRAKQGHKVDFNEPVQRPRTREPFFSTAR